MLMKAVRTTRWLVAVKPSGSASYLALLNLSNPA